MSANEQLARLSIPDISSSLSSNILMAHEAEIIIPGSFVVLQGNAGDGMSNTIDVVPEELTDEQFEAFRDQEEQQQQKQQEQQERVYDEDDLQMTASMEQQLTLGGGGGGRDGDEFQHVQDMTCAEEKADEHEHEDDDGLDEVERRRRTPRKQRPLRDPRNDMESTVSALSYVQSTMLSSFNRLPVFAATAATTPSATARTSAETAVGTTGNTTAAAATTTLDDSYLVVSDNDDSKPPAKSNSAWRRPQQQQQQQQQRRSSLVLAQVIDAWQTECRTREIRDRKEWKQSNSQQQQIISRQRRQQQASGRSSGRSNASSSRNNAAATATTATTTTGSIFTSLGTDPDATDSSDFMWWQSKGRVAIFRDIPTRSTDGSVQRKVIGTLSPGSTVVATEIVYLDSTTFERIKVRPTISSIFPRGRNGWIQLVRIALTEEQPAAVASSPPPSMLVAMTRKMATSSSTTATSAITDDDVSGYVTLSLDGYPLLAPGVPSLYVDPHVWTWRVTCPAGAYVRSGLDLNSGLIDTVPFGSLIRVTRKVVNDMGLSRLRVTGIVEGDSDKNKSDGDGDDDGQQQSPRVVDGWCSEFLNPLSGQRGIVVQPVPFPVPALYKVTLSTGAVIRSDVELSSSQIGIASQGTIVTVVGRAFSEHPTDRCIERLKLASGGWISVRLNLAPPDDHLVVDCVGIDGSFEPDDPGTYHLRYQQQQRQIEDKRRRRRSNSPDSGNGGGVGEISSIDDSDDASSSSSTSSSFNDHRKPKAATTTARTKKLPSTSVPQHRRDDNKCLICLTEERNATIVHGETGHVACCLVCARILRARGDKCPVCRLDIDIVIQHFWA